METLLKPCQDRTRNITTLNFHRLCRMLHLPLVNRAFNAVCRDPALWPELYVPYKTLMREAAWRSFIPWLAERASGLQTLVFCKPEVVPTMVRQAQWAHVQCVTLDPVKCTIDTLEVPCADTLLTSFSPGTRCRTEIVESHRCTICYI